MARGASGAAQRPPGLRAHGRATWDGLLTAPCGSRPETVGLRLAAARLADEIATSNLVTPRRSGLARDRQEQRDRTKLLVDVLDVLGRYPGGA